MELNVAFHRLISRGAYLCVCRKKKRNVRSRWKFPGKCEYVESRRFAARWSLQLHNRALHFVSRLEEPYYTLMTHSTTDRYKNCLEKILGCCINSIRRVVRINRRCYRFWVTVDINGDSRSWKKQERDIFRRFFGNVFHSKVVIKGSLLLLKKKYFNEHFNGPLLQKYKKKRHVFYRTPVTEPKISRILQMVRFILRLVTYTE